MFSKSTLSPSLSITAILSVIFSVCYLHFLRFQRSVVVVGILPNWQVQVQYSLTPSGSACCSSFLLHRNSCFSFFSKEVGENLVSCNTIFHSHTAAVLWTQWWRWHWAVGLLWQPSVIVAICLKYLYVHFLTENKLMMMMMFMKTTQRGVDSQRQTVKCTHLTVIVDTVT